MQQLLPAPFQLLLVLVLRSESADVQCVFKQLEHQSIDLRSVALRCYILLRYYYVYMSDASKEDIAMANA